MADERFLLFNHGQKERAIDTIIYELEMWRRSYAAIAPKREVFKKTHCDDDLYEYNLRIEGFLLHTRNLLAFFTDKHNIATDLTISRPEWIDDNVNPQVLQDFITRARAADGKHREQTDSCYSDISKYLSHCARLRHSSFKGWDSDAIFADLDPIFREFEARFVNVQGPRGEVVRLLGGVSNSTASFRT